MALSFEESIRIAAEKASLQNTRTIETYATEVAQENRVFRSVDEDWQLSDKYLYYAEYSDDRMSHIDENKNITLNSEQINLTQESNSQYIPFEMNRHYDGFDLFNTTLLFHFVNKEGYEDYSTPINMYYTDDKIRFAWLVDKRVTAVDGNVKFEIQAIGVNSKGDEYVWKTKPSDSLHVLKSLSGNGVIEPDSSWTTSFITQITEKVAEAQDASNTAKTYSDEAKAYSESASESANTVAATIEGAKEELALSVNESIDEKINSAMSGYYTKTEIDEMRSSLDSEISDVKQQIAELDGLANFNVEYDGKVMTFYNGASVIKEIEINSDPSEEWTTSYTASVDEKVAVVQDDLNNYKEEVSSSYYLKTETYSSSEIDEKLGNVTVDLSGYATEKYVDDKDSAINESIATNTNSISSLNKAVEDINQEISGIDNSPRVTYDATYGDVELDDGTIAEDMFTLWKTEGGIREVQDRFQIQGGGSGSGSGVTLKIAYVDGYTTPIVATVDDSAIVKCNFTGEDSAGDTNLDAVASWKVGNRVVATQDVSTGELEFDLTDYVTVGDNKVVLTITHATGAIATKAWTIKIVDVRMESSFDDTRANVANTTVTFTFTPYGGVEKIVHFLLDGEEIDTKVSSAAAAGLSDSFVIPAHAHGSHLFETYMTAKINGKEIESNHIVKDIAWYDASVGTPVIGCRQQNITVRQYEAVNIEYTVFDPSTETPNVVLNSSYVNDEQDVVNEYTSDIVMISNTDTWQFKTSIVGAHTLTITCGSTIKTIFVTVTELGITVSPVTTGLVFDFNPVGRSNNGADRLWSNGDISMTVSDNFDWVNGGYHIDENGDQYFCIKAGTSAEINYELFGDDAKTNGKQFKFVFKTANVASADAVFLSCLSDTIGTDKIGIEMKAHEATIYAKTDSLPLPYSEDEIIEFEFNVTPSSETPSMVMGYEDGVSTRPLVYDSAHDFQQYQGYRKKISLGSADCDLYIYRFKVYNTSLSDRDILNNFIADARSAEEMIKRYDRNQIYKEGLLDPDYLAEVCPQLRIIKLEVPHFTKDKDDKVYDANIPTIIESVFKGGDPIYDNWVAYDCVHAGQGTSSNNYGPAGRNLDLIMKSYKDYGNAPYIVLGDGSQVSKVSLTRESIPVNYFNVKVNIASSENANNALLQRRYNTYNPYKRPFVRMDESIISYIKDTMEFQNCVIFVKESDPDTTTHVEFADCNWHFYAIGNIGDSKKTDDTRLTDPDDPYECILEVMDNTLPNSTMPTGVVDENGAPVYPISPDEWTPGNPAYDSLHADKFDEKKSSEKENGLADTYGWRYIYEDGTDEQNAQYREFVESAWKEFYAFVVTSTDEEFKAHLGDYCVLDSVLYYYLFTLRYTMTDNHAKNSFWHYGKSNDLDTDGNPIHKWDLSFDYDNDTALGIDNYGRMTYRYGYEEIDYVDGTSDWVWNAPNHVFFLRIRKLFDDELCALYTRLESSGAWSSTSLINQFNEWQMQFPEELWRLDIERKYIRTYTSSFIGGKAYPEFLVERANGRKKTQRSQYERNQEKYIASKFGGTAASSDDIVLRCSVPNTDLVIEPNFDMHLTPYSYIYLNVKYNTSPPIRIRAVPDVEYTIPYTDSLADIIEIYSASCLKSVGDLSACYLTNGIFANAIKIRELILGNGMSGYDNANVMTLGLGSNELLEKLDVQNMSGLTHSLDLTGLKNLTELYAFGSSIGGVSFADAGNISIAQIPDIGSLEMKNLAELTDEGFEMASCYSLSKLVAENSVLDLVELINSCSNLRQVRLTGINWTLEDTTMLERLYKLSGVTNTGANTEKSVLTGVVHVPVIKQQQLYDYRASWPDLDIVFETMIEQYPVTFVNDDGSVIEVQYVDKGSDAVDPTMRIDNPIVPTKESSVSHDFTFAGWDSSLSSVFSARVITATYTESLRSYVVKYVSKGITMQETAGLYGENIPYTGVDPTYTAEESAYVYHLFNRWDKSGFVDGNKTINAIFDRFEYSDNSFDGRELNDLSPVEIYAITQLGIADSIIQDKDAYEMTIGNDIDFDDIESKLIISEKMAFNGTNYYDTGVKLFDEDRDFVLAIDYEFVDGNSMGNVLAQCFQANGSNGFKLWFNENTEYTGVRFTWGTTSNNVTKEARREMVVIRHKKGENSLSIYNSNLSGDSMIVASLDRTRQTIGDSTLVFGSAKADDGMFENFAIGNIYWCKLWYCDLGDDVCRDLAIWTHDKLVLEACGFRKYYLSENTSKRCSFSLLANGLLGIKKQWSAANSNEGGYAKSKLNSALNARFYRAIPAQIRSIIKQVKVPYSIGSALSDVDTVDCYVTVPACIEVDPTMTTEPYVSEGTSISYISTNTSRLRAYPDGTYGNYWLRSANAKYASYVYQVDSTGKLSGYCTPTSEAGILVEVSI